MRIKAGIVTQASPVLALALSMACSLSAQQARPEPSPVFSSESKLVLVPFNVVRDAHFVRDMKPDDVTLLQDGKPRDFGIFEGPGAQRRLDPVELVVLFDTTTLSEVEAKSPATRTLWNREATYAGAGKWSDADSSALLLNGKTSVLVSIYRFDHRQLQQLCRSTFDPRTLTRAIHRLPEPIPPEEAIPLTLPPNRETIRDIVVKQGGFKEDPKRPVIMETPSWTLEAVIDTLKDAFAAPGKAIRLLAVFSQGKGMTTTTPEDVAGQAIAFGIPVYPILLGHYFPPETGTRPSGADPDPSKRLCDPSNLREGLVCQDGASIQKRELGSVGELTGGRAFYPNGIDEKMVSNILVVIRNEGLFQYVVGFAPEPSGKQRTHRLEIRLKSKSSGKLRGGRRTAVY